MNKEQLDKWMQEQLDDISQITMVYDGVVCVEVIPPPELRSHEVAPSPDPTPRPRVKDPGENPPNVEPKTLPENVANFIFYYTKKKALEAEAKDYGGKASTLEKTCLEMMTAEGVDSIKMNGKNVHIKERVWAKIVGDNREAAVQAIKDAGFDDLVKEDFNAIQLSAFVSEFYNEGRDLPPEFEGIIEANPTYSLGVKKA